MEKKEIQLETEVKKTDLYLLTMDLLATKISFEEYFKKSVLWARAVMQPDSQENEEQRKK